MIDSFPFFVFCCVCVALVLPAAWSRAKLYSYPVMAALICIVFAIPQGFYVERTGFSEVFSGGRYWLYASACLIGLQIGFSRYSKLRGDGIKAEAVRAPPLFIDRKRGLVVAAALIVLGGASLQFAEATASAQSLGQQWTGVATFYYLLAQLLYFGITIAALLFFRRPSVIAGVILAFGLLLTYPAVFGMVKRHVIFELVFILGGALFFTRNVLPSRAAIVAIMIFGTLLLHQVGQVRQYIRDNNATAVEAILEGQTLSGFSFFNVNRAPEIEEGIYDVFYAAQFSDFNFGKDHWNKIVHQYLPGFLLGSEIKESLTLPTDTIIRSERIEDLDYGGATRTGFADSFTNFWWFGLFAFVAIGAFMGWAFKRARAGDTRAQFLYLILLADGLFAVTDSTARYLSGLPFTLFCAWLIFTYAKSMHKTHQAASRQRAELIV